MQTRSGLTYNTDDNQDYYLQLAQGFIRWKNKVNHICYSQTKMTCDDLPDQDYYSCYVEGVTPQQMLTTLTKFLYYDLLN